MFTLLCGERRKKLWKYYIIKKNVSICLKNKSKAGRREGKGKLSNTFSKSDASSCGNACNLLSDIACRIGCFPQLAILCLPFYMSGVSNPSKVCCFFFLFRYSIFVSAVLVTWGAENHLVTWQVREAELLIRTNSVTRFLCAISIEQLPTRRIK